MDKINWPICIKHKLWGVPKGASKGESAIQRAKPGDILLFRLGKDRGKKIGFVFQSFNLIPNLNAKENVMLPMLFQDVDEEDRVKSSRELLKLVRLENRADHYPNQVSGGQQQRVAIARALANNPDVILADEPTGNLDTTTGKKVLEFLNKLNKEGKTIILVTHDLNLAREHAEKIYFLKDGLVERTEKKISGKWRILK